jgi:hypothetical protein
MIGHDPDRLLPKIAAAFMALAARGHKVGVSRGHGAAVPSGSRRMASSET